MNSSVCVTNSSCDQRLTSSDIIAACSLQMAPFSVCGSSCANDALSQEKQGLNALFINSSN